MPAASSGWSPIALHRVLVRRGGVHALSRREAAAGFRQAAMRITIPTPFTDARSIARLRARDRPGASTIASWWSRATAGVFVAALIGFAPRAAAVLPALRAAGAVLPDAHAGGLVDRRHAGDGEAGRGAARGRRRHRHSTRPMSGRAAALLARPQPATAERGLCRDRHRRRRTSRRASGSRRGSKALSPTARCRRRGCASTASISARRSAFRCSSASSGRTRARCATSPIECATSMRGDPSVVDPHLDWNEQTPSRPPRHRSGPRARPRA